MCKASHALLAPGRTFLTPGGHLRQKLPSFPGKVAQGGAGDLPLSPYTPYLAFHTHTVLRHKQHIQLINLDFSIDQNSVHCVMSDQSVNLLIVISQGAQTGVSVCNWKGDTKVTGHRQH